MSKIVAAMSGNVWKVLVKEGDFIEAEQEVIILESMKMEIPVTPESSGVVQQINVKEGDFVDEGTILIKYKPSK